MSEEFQKASEIKIKEKMVLMKISPQEEFIVEFLKPFAKTKARTKVMKFALEKAYGIYKDLKP